MSKELIEKLREDGKFLGGNFGKLMHEAADALEAKAAPVGEREAFEAFWRAGFVTDTTKDLALLWEGTPAQAVNSRTFLEAIASRMA